MQIAVLAHPPPFEFCARRLQRQPGGDVGVVVHVGDDDLVAFRQHLADAEADQADEGGGIHTEADFLRPISVDQQGDAFARLRHRLVDLYAASIAAAALHIVADEMVGDGVEHALRYLRAGRIVEEDEVAGLLQRREHGADVFDGKGCGAVRFRGLMLVHGNFLEHLGREWGRDGSARLFDFEPALQQADETHHRPEEDQVGQCRPDQRRGVGVQRLRVVGLLEKLRQGDPPTPAMCP